MMRRAIAALLVCLGAAGSVRGQALSPPGTGGVAALTDLLERVGATKRVLVIGAHPDDEDTQLLTLLSRGHGVQAAYLSLTRGEGGQNLIGPELGEGLGIIRTEELLAARALDGAGQFFTRAFDFGYSRSAEETFTLWSGDSLLADVIAVIRRFRPQILVSIFSGTPRDGHGQHQAAGILARRAFDALRDSTWGPIRLYRSTRFDSAATTLELPAGELDPVLGQSYAQIAMAGRSRHRSQDMGQLQRAGPSTVRLQLVVSRVPGGDAALFAGIDTTVSSSPRYRALVDSARAALNPWRPAAIVPFLARARRELAEGLADQRALLGQAVALAAGVALDALADDALVHPDQRLQVEVQVWNAGAGPVSVESVELVVPQGWGVERLEPAAGDVAAGTVALRRFVVRVAPDAERSQPYYLHRPRLGAMYDWTGVPPAVRGRPFENPPVSARVVLGVAGERVTLEREVVYRLRDQAVGEVRRPLIVTQEFDVALDPARLVWPVTATAARPVTVTVTNRTRGPGTARLTVTPPPGWRPIRPIALTFEREDETHSVTVALTPPAPLAPGSDQVHAAVSTDGGRGGRGGLGGRRSEGGLTIVDYPHIRPRPWAGASTVAIHTAEIVLPPLTRVGYVRGASDRVPEELRAVGVPIVLLAGDSLRRGDLSTYDAIVIGSRAYETDSALTESHVRLLDYARAGGLLIVQYQQYPFVRGNYPPHPLTIGQPHDRITDETAAVTSLEPRHPLFHYPNAIGPADWDGWVQERGLYFARDWDSVYVPLLEMADPGLPPQRGSLLVAPLGRGTYVYTALSFFRQLPAGVPGAFRLFANLLGLGRRE